MEEYKNISIINPSGLYYNGLILLVHRFLAIFYHETLDNYGIFQ